MKTDSDELTSYLLDEISADTVAALRALGSVKYPVPDQKTWREVLREAAKGKDAGVGAAIDRISRGLSPTDFPVLTPRSALEKLAIRVPGLIWPRFRLQVPDPRETVEEPDLYDVYTQTFGEQCGDVAYREYAAARRQGIRHYPAIVIGHQAGSDCFDALPPEEQERIRRMRRRYS